MAEDMEWKRYAIRIRSCAFDLLSMGDAIDDEDSWDIFKRYLMVKSVCLFVDFSQFISKASPDEKKKSLTQLGNKLFSAFGEFHEAVKLKDMCLSQQCYNDTVVILQEVVAAMPAAETLDLDHEDDDD